MRVRIGSQAVAEPVAKPKNFQSMLVFSLPVVPLLATVGIISAYEIDASLAARAAGALAVVALWPAASFLARERTKPEAANVSQYDELKSRLTALKTRADQMQTPEGHVKLFLPKPEAQAECSAGHVEAAESAFSEASKHIEDANSTFAAGGTIWIHGRGYQTIWKLVHRAEEALISVEPLEDLLADTLKDEEKLDGSLIANAKELMIKLGRACDALNPDGATYLDRPTRAAATAQPNAQSACWKQADARSVLRDVRNRVNEYRDNNWDGIIRTKGRLLDCLLITGVVVLAFVALLLVARPDAKQVLGGTIYFLVGAMVAVFNQLRTQSALDNAVEDYGLGLARLVIVPVVAGVAALLGVVVLAELHVQVNGIAVSPGGPQSGDISLGTLFTLTDTNVAGLLAAAIFGLTPGLLIDYLSNSTKKLQDGLKSSEPTNKGI